MFYLTVLNKILPTVTLGCHDSIDVLFSHFRKVSVRDLKVVVSKAVMPRDMRVLLMKVGIYQLPIILTALLHVA